MLSYKRCFINTDTANRIDSLLESKSKTAKKEVKEIIEGIDVFYIIPNGVNAADYHELIFYFWIWFCFSCNLYRIWKNQI